MVRCTGNPSGTSVIAMSSGPSRSIGALDRSRLANEGCSRSRWVKAGHPTIPVARSRSIRSSASEASSRGRTNRVTGSCSAPVVASSPPTQKNGMAQRILADDPEPVTVRIALGHVDVCRTRVPWVCTTPFGSAVDPEVWIMTAGSAGETSCSTALRISFGTRASASSLHRVAQRRRSASAVSTMRRRYGAERRER